MQQQPQQRGKEEQQILKILNIPKIQKHQEICFRKYSKKLSALHYVNSNYVRKTVLYRQYKTGGWAGRCATIVSVNQIRRYYYMYLVYLEELIVILENEELGSQLTRGGLSSRGLVSVFYVRYLDKNNIQSEGLQILLANCKVEIINICNISVIHAIIK